MVRRNRRNKRRQSGRREGRKESDTILACVGAQGRKTGSTERLDKLSIDSGFTNLHIKRQMQE